MSDNKELALASPAEMIRQAVAGGADLTKLEKLLELQERWDANNARKEFAKFFSMAQSDIEAVIKTKENTQTHSKYAELGDVIETAKPAYTRYGFSVIFYEGDCPKENHIRIFADVLHGSGHKETYHYDVPLDGKGLRGNDNMTAIHGKASSVSYGRRYLMCMIWNIPTADNDGNTQKLPTITEKQLHILRDLIISKDMEEKKLLEFLAITSLEDLKEGDYMKAMSAINNFKKVGK